MTNSANPSSMSGYAEQAAVLTTLYESVTFDDVHREVLHLIPTSRSRVLDIGAGTGRDAAALAKRGHRVVAVEPTRELREAGMTTHRDADLQWVNDELPDLTALQARQERFDLVMLTAVWMHLDAEERQTGMHAIAGLLANDGTIIMSLRHGPVPEGRRMFDVSAEDTIALAALQGLRPVHCSRRTDMLGRGDVSWSHLALRLL